MQSHLRREGLSAKEEAVLEATGSDAPFAEIEELGALVSEGRERGYLTFEEIAACLEEVEVTKEQLHELHSHLEEHGVEVVSGDGKPMPGPEPGGASDKDPSAPKLDPVQLVLHASVPVKVVLLLLLFFSVLCWIVIGAKFLLTVANALGS